MDVEEKFRKNQERDSRLENKKRHEQGSINFGFGSAMPRLMEPMDSGTISPSQYWGQRMRISERGLSDGLLKRANSAGGLDRQIDDDSSDSPWSHRNVHRKKTDLIPTVPIPIPRDTNFGSKSFRDFASRTPGSSGSMTRLDQLALPIRHKGEHIRSVIERQERHQSMPRTRSLTNLSGTSGGAKKLNVFNQGLRKKSISNSMSQLNVTKQQTTRNAKFSKKQPMNDTGSNASAADAPSTSAPIRSTDTPKRKEKRLPPSNKKPPTPRPSTPILSRSPMEAAANVTTGSIEQTTEIPMKRNQSEKNLILSSLQQENEMTASMKAKKIITADDAKAALAERRRIAREEAEKLADSERQRKEAEELAQQQRIANKEEDRRRLEEERLRLVEEQKKTDELRMFQAIEDAKRKDEEERKKKETEEIAQIEREENARKAREEAEKLKNEKLRKEEKEREERRKRVELIMSRMRKGVNPGNTPNKVNGLASSAQSNYVLQDDKMSPSNSDNDLVKTGTNENNSTQELAANTLEIKICMSDAKMDSIPLNK